MPSSRAAVLLACSVLAASAHASYGQMRLDGIGIALAMFLLVGWGLLLDVLVVAPAHVFRHRAAAIAGTVVGALIALLLLVMLAIPRESAGYFKGQPGGSGLFALLATCAVFLPFILFAPWALHRSLAQGLQRPRWVGFLMWAQAALFVATIILPLAEYKFYSREYEEGFATGAQAREGGIPQLLEQAGRRRDRIWATPIPVPGSAHPPDNPYGPRPAWITGLAGGLDETALIQGDGPLSPADRTALDTLVTRYFGAYSASRARAHLLWDALAPGNFATVLARDRADEEVINDLLDRFDRSGASRFCPDGRMAGADRAALKALVAERGYRSEDYLRRVEGLCALPG